MRLRQRDIVLVPVPFTDLTTLKRRPALVLSCDAFLRGGEDLIVAALPGRLSRPHHGERSGEGRPSAGQLGALR